MKIYAPVADNGPRTTRLATLDHEAILRTAEPDLCANVASLRTVEELRQAVSERMAAAALAERQQQYLGYYAVTLLRTGGIPAGFPPVLPMQRATLLDAAAMATNSGSTTVATASPLQHQQHSRHRDPTRFASVATMGPVASFDHVAVCVAPTPRAKEYSRYIDTIDDDASKFSSPSLTSTDAAAAALQIGARLTRVARVLFFMWREHIGPKDGPGIAGPFDPLLMNDKKDNGMLLQASLGGTRLVQKDVCDIDRLSYVLPPPVRESRPKAWVTRFIFYGEVPPPEQLAAEPACVRELIAVMPPFKGVTVWWLLMACFAICPKIDSRFRDLVDFLDTAVYRGMVLRDRASIAILSRVPFVKHAALHCGIPHKHPDGNADHYTIFSLAVALYTRHPADELASVVVDSFSRHLRPFPAEGFPLPVTDATLPECLLAAHANREDELIAKLVQRYGPEPKPLPKTPTTAFARVSTLAQKYSIAAKQHLADTVITMESLFQQAARHLVPRLGKTRSRWYVLAILLLEMQRDVVIDGTPRDFTQVLSRAIALDGLTLIGYLLQASMLSLVRESLDCKPATGTAVDGNPVIVMGWGEDRQEGRFLDLAMRAFSAETNSKHWLLGTFAPLLEALDAQSWHGPDRWAMLRLGGCSDEVAADPAVRDATYTGRHGTFSVTIRLQPRHLGRPAHHIAIIEDSATGRTITFGAVDALLGFNGYRPNNRIIVADLPHALSGRLKDEPADDPSNLLVESLNAAVQVLQSQAESNESPMIVASWASFRQFVDGIE